MLAILGLDFSLEGKEEVLIDLRKRLLHLLFIVAGEEIVFFRSGLGRVDLLVLRIDLSLGREKVAVVQSGTPLLRAQFVHTVSVVLGLFRFIRRLSPLMLLPVLKDVPHVNFLGKIVLFHIRQLVDLQAQSHVVIDLFEPDRSGTLR